jgi:ATP synthase F1 delta subunit
MEKIDIHSLYAWAGEEAREIAEEMIRFCAELKHNFEIKLFLSNYNIPLAKRKEVAEALVFNYSVPFKQLLGLLLEKELIPGIDRLTERFVHFVETQSETRFAEIESAFPLENKEIEKIKTAFGTNVKYRTRLNPELIGGFVIRFMDGRVFDGSLKGKLNQMKMEMAG